MAHVHGAANAAKEAIKHTAGETAKREVVHAAAKSAVTGSALAAAAKHSLLGRLVRHPAVLFGLGLAAGYAIHKYRREIIGAANRAAEKSKDFVLQQRENLEDLVAESQESED